MSDLSGIFRQPFAEQVAAWRQRLGDLRPTQTWTDVEAQFHDRGFMVAGAMKADLLADLAAAVDKAVTQGTSLEEFRADFRKIVAERGWHGWTGEGTAKGEAWRTRTIYRTNMATTYHAGRHAQLVAGNFAFWVYRHGNAREPRVLHLAWNGIALPPSHPFWLTHYTPNGWGCTCYITGARTAAGVRRVGGDPDKPLPPGWDAINPKTGEQVGIDKGWGYAPGASVVDAVAATKNKLPRLPASVGAAMFAAMPRSAVDEITREFDAFVTKALASRIERNFMIVGAMRPSWIDAASKRGVPIASAEIAVTDLNVQHTFRGTSHVSYIGTRRRAVPPKHDALDLNWYRDLPRHLLAPKAVILDRSDAEPTILLVYDVPGRKAKLVVEINTFIKKAGGLLNTVQSGRLVNDEDLKSTLGRHAEIIEGGI